MIAQERGGENGPTSRNQERLPNAHRCRRRFLSRVRGGLREAFFLEQSAELYQVFFEKRESSFSREKVFFFQRPKCRPS